MSTTVYATGNGAIRARIEASGSALSLFRARPRNKIISEALVFAGNAWLGKFKPLRFTDYVMRQPFGYPRRAVGLAMSKLRGATAPPLSTIWNGIKAREFSGWDPWGNQPIPEALTRKVFLRDRSRYKYQIGPWKGRIHWRILKADTRAWCKKRTREYAANLSDDGAILPLVRDGKLRDEYSAKSRATATATAKRARLTITIPRGDRQNKWAVKILGMLPVWEFNQIVKWFDAALKEGIATGFVAGLAGGPARPAGAGRPRGAGGPAPRGAGA